MLTHNPYAKTKRYRPAQPTSQQHQQPPSAAATNSNHATNSVGTTVVPTKSSDITQTCNEPPAKKPCLISTSRSAASNSAIRHASQRHSQTMISGCSQLVQRPRQMAFSVPQEHHNVSINTCQRTTDHHPPLATQQNIAPAGNASKPTIQMASPVTNPYLKSNRQEQFKTEPPPRSHPPSQMPSPVTTLYHSDGKLPRQINNTLETTPQSVGTTVVPTKSSDITQTSNVPPAKKPCLISTGRSSAENSAIRQNQSTQPSNSTLGSIRPTSWGQKAGDQPKSMQQKPPSQPNQQRIELPGEAMLPEELSFSPDDVKPIEDGNRKDLVRHANLQKPLLNGWTLYPHQKKSILQCLVKRRMILALDMGLGKTLIGCVWAKSFKSTFDNLKVFVICPVSLKAEWKRTAENTTGLSVEDEKANSNKKSLDLRICSWAKVPTKVESNVDQFVAVFDEAHSMQSMNSARTKDSIKLVLDERCAGVLLLTGTPMKNGKPSNLFPLLKAVRHPLGKDQTAYEKHFCAGMLKNFGRGKPVWDANGCSNLKQLKRLVSSNLLHLTKDQCLSLPPLKRERYQVPISHRNQLQYIQAVKNLASLQAASYENKNVGEAVLGAVQQLRSQCSFAKIGATVELTKKILEQEPSVVIFTSFAKVAKCIHSQLASSGWDSELLTGETPQKKRQSMVDNFQAGHSAAFVCTFGAGGVGLTLTASCSVILLDRPWTPGDTRQAEDRIRRIGQTKNSKSYWMSGFELDKQIDDMIVTKEEASNAVLAEGVVSAGPAAKINIPKLLHCLLAKVS